MDQSLTVLIRPMATLHLSVPVAAALASSGLSRRHLRRRQVVTAQASGDSTFTSPKAGAVGVKRLQEGAAPGTYYGPKIENGNPITVEFDLGSETITVESREGENLLHLAERCGAMKPSEEFCFEGTCCHCEMEVEGGASEAGYRAMGGSDLIRSCICPVPGRNGGTLKVRILSEEDAWGDGVL
ncbi:unnamed protein product [Closterium sp. NIES-64]|nr:unnamed protein product [Closterium sp. NIES-64]